MIMLNGKRIDGTIGDALPIGTLSPFVGLVAPKGYLICMGQLVDKAKYPELWELCGDTFGQSTATQFYLPDLRGQVIAGYKEGDAIFGTLGGLIGALTATTQNHTLTVNEIPGHRHGLIQTYNVPSGTGPGGIALSDFSGTVPSGLTGPAGGDASHNHGDVSIIQPTAVMNWIIKASMIAVIESNIEDSLTSTSATDALSAKQGKILKDLVDVKVNTSDIINNLTSTTTNKPLSAAQGKALNDKVTNLKRVELFSGSWARGETKTIDTSSYVKLEILMSLNPSGSAYSTIYTISYDNAGNRTGLISGVTKCMNGYFYQVEIQKQASNKIFFDYGAYAHQESMNSWTQDSTSKGIITKVYGYKEI